MSPLPSRPARPATAGSLRAPAARGGQIENLSVHPSTKPGQLQLLRARLVSR